MKLSDVEQIRRLRRDANRQENAGDYTLPAILQHNRRTAILQQPDLVNRINSNLAKYRQDLEAKRSKITSNTNRDA